MQLIFAIQSWFGPLAHDFGFWHKEDALESSFFSSAAVENQVFVAHFQIVYWTFKVQQTSDTSQTSAAAAQMLNGNANMKVCHESVKIGLFSRQKN